MLRRRTPSRFPRSLRFSAAVAAGAVLVTSGVVSAPQPAQAVWQDDAQNWISSMETGLGWAEGLFGIKTGPWNTALSIAGPLISAIFGGSSAPSIQDVLDRLKQLDDIEHKIDQVQKSLVTIEAEIATVGQDVLTGTCTVQASRLRDFLTKLDLANDSYSNVVDKIDEVRVGTASEEDLQIAINSFVAYATGESAALTPDRSEFAESIRSVHSAMGTAGGVAGVIQSCGRAYLNDWKIANASTTALNSMPTTQQGAWLDDRAYYEPLQELVSFWQTAAAHGTYLHQQASLMRATKEYVLAKGPLTVEDSSRVCALAKQNGPAKTKAICEGGLSFAQTIYNNFAAEWREVGVPISDDNVVMSMGTDVNGLVYQATTPRAPGAPTTVPLVPNGGPVSVPSRVWARNPATFPANWTTGTWSTAAQPVTAFGVEGFTPAGSKEWHDLSNAYRASHPTVQPATLEEGFVWNAPSGYQNAGVQPFAPLDVLATMGDAVAPVVPGVDPAHAFTVDRNSSVWLPNETASHNFPMWRSPIPEWSRGSGLSFPHSRFWLPFNFAPRVMDDAMMSVKCFVATEDGIVCNETVGSWWVNSLDIVGSVTPQDLYRVIPRSPNVDSLLVIDRQRECRGQPLFDEECATVIDTMLRTRGETAAEGAPAWLGPMTAANGQDYEGDPAATATLWPSAPVPECAVTTWGAKTRCGAVREAWIAAHIPNPSLTGPVAADSPVIEQASDRAAACRAPDWNTTSAIRYSDVAWTGWSRSGAPFTKVVPFGSNLDLLAFVTEAGWAAGGDAGESGQTTLRCSFTARTAEVANTTAVQSGIARVTRAGDRFTITGVGTTAPGTDPGGPPGSDGAQTDPPAAHSGPGGQPRATSSIAATAGREHLARSGVDLPLWSWTVGGGLLLSGALIAFLTARRPGRGSSPFRSRRR